ncbi:glycogen debranching protein GlgX [Candidatus Laterigemmans baculatus]|uniref:glycogen debranching protein GlgX n=1 Tax=Candidatus Laterigemmans baculatus TaxID=2770505 RepID=UPI0013DAAB51|nr:glycogen debranching protein GlgX [Candidatus Laterigemmans baculatus]
MQTLMLQRVDAYATRTIAGMSVRAGRVFPFGATLVAGGVNFSVFSRHATACTLVLYEKGAAEPFAELPFPDEFRVGDVYAMTVFELDHENLEYGYRMDGPNDPSEGHRFDPSVVLMDPYARQIGGREVWGQTPDWDQAYQHRSQVLQDDFDWEHDRPLELAAEDLVIYEAHVRSFTQHPSSNVRHPGTFAGLREKIPYLKSLGINCLELMPIFEFDEFENSSANPANGQLRYNYWGYSTVGFFAPKAGYAATGPLGMQADELKTLIKDLHRNGIEVMLDVVFNHTAEGDHRGPTISFRGLDNKTYYMLTPEGYYYNFSGCGNTLNCNNPIVRQVVLDCLRYWVSEYHIDGFRFDLAAILGRDPSGVPLANPPLLESLAHDPVLGRTKLVAEAWDAGGLYQVGSFPAYGRWAEWNGKYRDTARKFLKGDMGQVSEMSLRLQGSPDLYYGRGTAASINFLTCHDGFTLRDLVSYNEKHNEANGESNRDGANDNESWNCGAEGATDDRLVESLRLRQMKNAATLLMVSQGIPMILMGDEVGRTKQGNNNTYCHDNELNWFNWWQVEENAELQRFFQKIIAFRHAHPVLRSRDHLRHADWVGSGVPDISWHGTRAWEPDWSALSRVVGLLLGGHHAKGGTVADDDVYVASNMHFEALEFELPRPAEGRQWHVAVNTGVPAPGDAHPCGEEPMLEQQDRCLVGGRSVVVLVGR